MKEFGEAVDVVSFLELFEMVNLAWHAKISPNMMRSTSMEILDKDLAMSCGCSKWLNVGCDESINGLWQNDLYSSIATLYH